MKNLKNINEFWGAVIRRDMSSAVREEDKFHNKEELIDYLKKEIEKQGENVVIRNLDVSGIEDLNNLFRELFKNVKTLDLSGWNTEGVKSMSGMFFGCENLESLDLSGWNTSSVTDMSWMFYFCENLKSLDLSGWDTSSVTYMNCMFYICKSLNNLDLSSWDTSSVKNMGNMFKNCNSLKSLDLSGWDTSSVSNMCIMFDECPAPYEVVNNKIVRK